jgi:hypothetical protein
MHRCRPRTDPNLQQQLTELSVKRAQLERAIARLEQSRDEDAGIMILLDSQNALFVTPVKEKP